MGEHKTNIFARHPLVAFFALSFLLFLVLFVAAGMAFTLEAPAWLQYLTQALSSWSPNFAAVIVTGAVSGSRGVRKLLSGFLKWRVKLVWYLVAIGIPIVLGLAVAGIYYLLAGRPPDVLASFTITTFLGTVLNHLFRGPLGEEAGWRGFALPRLQARYGALKSSLILGLAVVVWHVPTWFMKSSGRKPRRLRRGGRPVSRKRERRLVEDRVDLRVGSVIGGVNIPCYNRCCESKARSSHGLPVGLPLCLDSAVPPQGADGGCSAAAG